MIRKPHSAAASGLCTAGAALAEERGATLKETSVSGNTDKPPIRDC